MIDLLIWVIGRIHSGLVELRQLRTTVRALSSENNELRQEIERLKKL